MSFNAKFEKLHELRFPSLTNPEMTPVELRSRLPDRQDLNKSPNNSKEPHLNSEFELGNYSDIKFGKDHYFQNYKAS